jgi:hypothetical protein
MRSLFSITHGENNQTVQEKEMSDPGVRECPECERMRSFDLDQSVCNDCLCAVCGAETDYTAGDCIGCAGKACPGCINRIVDTDTTAPCEICENRVAVCAPRCHCHGDGVDADEEVCGRCLVSELPLRSGENSYRLPHAMFFNGVPDYVDLGEGLVSAVEAALDSALIRHEETSACFIAACLRARGISIDAIPDFISDEGASFAAEICEYLSPPSPCATTE